jgi:hypothetical protein
MILFMVLALLGFVASLVVQISTFAASPGLGMGRTWFLFLHVGVFVVFIPMALSQRNDRAGGGAKGGRAAAQWPNAPAWMKTVLAVCVVYALVSFGLMVVNAAGGRDGKLTTRDGRHVVVNHGQVVREVDERAYLADQARNARGFSAYWMVFYLASFVGLYDGLARRRAARAALPAFPALPASIRHTNSYERAPAPRMSPWAHATVGAILSLVGFVALPMGVAALFLSTKPSGGGWIFLVAPVFFGAAVVGLRLPGALMSRYVAAACPACGGRAYADGPALGNEGGGEVCYTCRDCGRVSRTDGSEAGPAAESRPAA